MHQYPSDISREEYALIREDLESSRKKTRPREYDLYDVFCAVIYSVRTCAKNLRRKQIVLQFDTAAEVTVEAAYHEQELKVAQQKFLFVREGTGPWELLYVDY